MASDFSFSMQFEKVVDVNTIQQKFFNARLRDVIVEAKILDGMRCSHVQCNVLDSRLEKAYAILWIELLDVVQDRLNLVEEPLVAVEMAEIELLWWLGRMSCMGKQQVNVPVDVAQKSFLFGPYDWAVVEFF